MLILFITCVQSQHNYYDGQNMKPRISLEFDMPLTELVDTCHSYAEQKGIRFSVCRFLNLFYSCLKPKKKDVDIR